MQVFCSCCEQWTPLPSHTAGGAHANVLCKHCTAPLPVDSSYRACKDCGHHFLTQYESCPLCYAIEHAETGATPEESLGYSKEVRSRKSRKGEYYWQVYFNYEDQARGMEPQQVASDGNINGHKESQNGHAAGAVGTNGSTQAVAANGNGHAAHIETTLTSGTENGTDGHNVHGNGNGKNGIDLALADSVPMGLFTDAEMGNVPEEKAGPVTVSAGNYNDFEYELISDPSRLAQVAEMLAQEKIVGIDTETTGLDPHTSKLLLLQISTLDKVYIVDCKKLLPLALKPFLENPDIEKVAQNAKFEYEMLKQQAGITLSNLYDTMLAERVLTSGISREISLKAIAQKYIGAVLDKSVRESFYKTLGDTDAYLADEQLHYAARDAFIMIPVQRLQLSELKKHKLEQVVELEFKCIAAVGDMELAGVKIDEERWRKIIADVQIQRDKSSEELCEILAPGTMQTTMFGVPSINLNSNLQLIEAFSQLGVDLPDTMEATLVKFNHPAVQKLLEYRGHEKTLSAFGENVLGLVNPKTGRIHPDFNQHGADTGRFSCTKPNVQQIPATSDFRKCFVAPEGYKLVTCDYSQAELRILAELSGDEGFVSAFKSGGDLHALTASQMFGVPLEDVQKAQRSAAKSINFGLAYGRGPGSLAVQLGVTPDEAKELIAKYFKAYPGVQRWLDKAAKDSVRLGYSVTTLGRKRFYNMPDESLKRTDHDEYRRQIGAIERQGKNSPIQGGNADMTKLALINLRTALKDWEARTVNTVHDEIVVEVRADQAEEVKHIVEREMVRAGEAILQSVPVVADASLADYWSK